MNGYPSEFISVDMGNGRVVAVEVRNVTPDQPVGIRDVLSFDGVTDSVEAVAERISRALERAKPHRAAVEFGIDVSVESGILTGLIAKGAGGATLKVTLEWERAASGHHG